MKIFAFSVYFFPLRESQTTTLYHNDDVIKIHLGALNQLMANFKLIEKDLFKKFPARSVIRNGVA